MGHYQERLEYLTEKNMDFEDRDFFRYVSYELDKESFMMELDAHEYSSWIPIHCEIKNINTTDYREGLWARYCGNIL